MILQTNHNLIKQLSRSTGELFDFFLIFFFFFTFIDWNDFIQFIFFINPTEFVRFIF